MRKRSDPLVGSSNLPLRSFLLRRIGAPFERKYKFVAVTSSYGHITVKAPHPIRTAKLSTVELDQYFGRGLQGNLQCCMAFCFVMRKQEVLQRKYKFVPESSSYGHITVKAPHPIRTAKLSTVELDQYFGRGLQGNLQCCMASFIFFDLFCVARRTPCWCCAEGTRGIGAIGSVRA